MSTAESAPQGAEDEVCRVLDFIATCPDGASYFTVTTELGIARTRAVSILEKLHRDGKLSYDCKTKMYFSRLEPMEGKEGSPPAQRDRLAGYERKIDAGLIMTPDPEADRAAPDRFPKEEKNKCQYCGKVVEKYLWQHENYCKENPDHRTPPGAASKKRKESDLQPTEEPEPAPTEALERECEGEACVIGAPKVIGPGPKLMKVPAPDPLALFAQQHRVRVGREISKLKRVERKLRRRASSLENMSERVRDARQIKERELRKFEREIAEARP